MYQGSVGAAFKFEQLKELGITHILTCATDIGARFPDNFEYLQLPLLDTPKFNIRSHFDTAREFINNCRNKQGRVLVHCFAGKSRASTVTISYMMAEMKIDLQTAFKHVKSKRSIALPNIGFLMQLM